MIGGWRVDGWCGHLNCTFVRASGVDGCDPGVTSGRSQLPNQPMNQPTHQTRKRLHIAPMPACRDMTLREP